MREVTNGPSSSYPSPDQWSDSEPEILEQVDIYEEEDVDVLEEIDHYQSNENE